MCLCVSYLIFLYEIFIYGGNKEYHHHGWDVQFLPCPLGSSLHSPC